ncbi:MAG: ImuA family protein [Rhodospirillaceae bacterium]
MDTGRKTAVLKDLRERIHRLERLESPARHGTLEALPFAIPALDGLWPEGGLPTCALHEVNGTGVSGFAAATAFAAAIAGRLSKPVVWCTTWPDFYAPGLAQVGLPATRLCVVRARSEKEVLAAMEEALRHAAVGCVIGETPKLNLTTSRRLQLAAESGASLAITLRRRKKDAELEPIAAATRWKVSAAPSSPHRLAHLKALPGRGRWTLELLRSRSGHTGIWNVEVPDAQGYLHLPSALADGIEAAPPARLRIAG